MRQQPSGRRPRGRSNRKHFVPHRSQTYDSHGPDVRVRGNAMQVYEKYVALSRDASAGGDRIIAESYQQYAEHYYRIINDTTDPQRPATERAEADVGAPERSGFDRQTGGPRPYPMDAEQPFVDGGGITSAAESNGDAPPAKAAAEQADGPAAGPSVGDGKADAPPVEEKKEKPRGRGRGRVRAKAGNGAAADGDAEAAPSPEPGKAEEASEPTS